MLVNSVSGSNFRRNGIHVDTGLDAQPPRAELSWTDRQPSFSCPLALVRSDPCLARPHGRESTSCLVSRPREEVDHLGRTQAADQEGGLGTRATFLSIGRFGLTATAPMRLNRCQSDRRVVVYPTRLLLGLSLHIDRVLARRHPAKLEDGQHEAEQGEADADYAVVKEREVIHGVVLAQ